MESFSSTTLREVLILVHTWSIEGFDLSQRIDAINGLKSNIFAASEDSNDKFYFKVSTYSDMVVNLNCVNTEIKNKYIYNIQVLFEHRVSKKISRNFHCAGSQCHIKRFDLYPKDTKHITPDDTLKIRCEIRMVPTNPECITKNIVKVPDCTLFKNLRTLFFSGKFSDVTIITGDDKKIRAHKAILSARSKVFDAMFMHPLEEMQENCVTISDFSHDVVNEMIRFIYTECAPKLKDMTVELLSAADKYDLHRLKSMCFKVLNEDLCVENAALTFKMANLYKEEGLKLNAIQFIKDNYERVAETPQWQALVKNERNLILESFCALNLEVNNNEI